MSLADIGIALGGVTAGTQAAARDDLAYNADLRAQNASTIQSLQAQRDQQLHAQYQPLRQLAIQDAMDKSKRANDERTALGLAVESADPNSPTDINLKTIRALARTNPQLAATLLQANPAMAAAEYARVKAILDAGGLPPGRVAEQFPPQLQGVPALKYGNFDPTQMGDQAMVRDAPDPYAMKNALQQASIDDSRKMAAEAQRVNNRMAEMGYGQQFKLAKDQLDHQQALQVLEQKAALAPDPADRSNIRGLADIIRSQYSSPEAKAKALEFMRANGWIQ